MDVKSVTCILLLFRLQLFLKKLPGFYAASILLELERLYNVVLGVALFSFFLVVMDTCVVSSLKEFVFLIPNQKRKERKKKEWIVSLLGNQQRHFLMMKCYN